MNTCRRVLLFFIVFYLSICKLHGEGKFNIQTQVGRKFVDDDIVWKHVLKRERRSVFNVILITHATISGGFDIYKYVRGCEDYPNFSDNLKTYEDKIEAIKKLKDEINLAWAPVVNMQRYFERLASAISIIDEQISKFENLQNDIFLTLDPKIIEKLNALYNEIKSDIEANNATYLMDTDSLTEKYATKLYFAYRLISNFEPIVKAATFKLAKGVGNLMGASTTAKAVGSNPSAFRRFVNFFGDRKAALGSWTSAKVAAFKNSITNSFNSFLSRHAKIQGAWNRVVTSPKAKAKWAKVGAGLNIAAQSLFLGGFIGYDIIMGLEFFKECESRTEKLDEIIRNATAEENIMVDMKREINDLLIDITGNYTELKEQFTTEAFLSFVENTEEFYRNNSDSSDTVILKAAKNLQAFREQIHTSSAKESDTLINDLISALTDTNIKLNCVFNDAKMIRSSINDCSTGAMSLEDIYKEASATNTISACQSDPLMGSTFKAAIESEMRAENFYAVCLRNNYDKFTIVCSNWYRDVSNDVIASKANLTLSEVSNMILICPPGSISVTDKTAICFDKQTLSLTEAKKKYYKFDVRELENVYENCPLTSIQIVNVCVKKSSGLTLLEVQSAYQQYNSTDVMNVYDACVVALTNRDKTGICLLKSYVNFNSSAFDSFKQRFTVSVVEETYNNCP